MKLASMMLALAFAATACGGKQGGDTTTPPTGDTTSTPPDTSTQPPEPGATGTGDGQPCTQEIAMVCPEDQIDACLKTPPEGDVHKCVAK